MKEKLKNQKGITLIALVVTIVVLLILAGVSISLILDNNGIIQKSKDAKREYGQARENEQADLNKASSWIDEVANAPEIVEPENINDWEYREEDDDTITLTSYKGTDTTVIIPNSINGKKVKKISGDTTGSTDSHARYFSIWNKSICNGNENTNFSSGYCKGQDTITKVIISEGIEEIESGAFEFSDVLEQITIPDTVRTIGHSAFMGCMSLKEIDIPKGVDKLEEYMFEGCYNLEKITIPENITSIGRGAFWLCTKLESVDISNNVTTIGDVAFYYCDKLTNITIPENVTTMGEGVFSDIPSITVNVPFKEGETPEGWNVNWNKTSDNCTITVNYAK